MTADLVPAGEPVEGELLLPEAAVPWLSRDQAVLDEFERGTGVLDLADRWGVTQDRVKQIIRVQRRLEGEQAKVAAPVPVEMPQTQVDRDRTVLWAEEVEATMRDALAPNTWDAYMQQWRQFLRWCAEWRRTPLPAQHETLLSYAKWMQREALSPSTLRIAMAALKKVHGFDQLADWLGSSEAMKSLLVGYERQCARDPERQPKRSAGARTVIMRALLDTCDPATARGARDRAALLLGYYLAARRSELANLRLSDRRYTVEGLEVRIAYSKTDQTGEGAWVAVPANDEHAEYDPVRALEAWVKVLRDDGATNGPLFRAVRASGLIRHTNTPVSGTMFEGIWNRAVAAARAKAEEAGDEKMQTLLAVRLTPHSGRRGYATDARAAGWDLIDITRHGRWSPQSKAVHIYIEEIDKWLRHQHKPVQL
jgi:integrase